MAWLGPENWGALPMTLPTPPVDAVDLTDGDIQDSGDENNTAGKVLITINGVKHLICWSFFIRKTTRNSERGS